MAEGGDALRGAGRREEEPRRGRVGRREEEPLPGHEKLQVATSGRERFERTVRKEKGTEGYCCLFV